MKRLGIDHNETGHNILSQHFQEVVQLESNIIQKFSSQHGTFEVRESLLFGPSGKAARLETTFKLGKMGCVVL